MSAIADLEEIHNLTSEIESFVRKADTEQLRNSPEKTPVSSTPIKNQITHTVEIASPPKENGYTRTTTITTTATTNTSSVTKGRPSESPEANESQERSPDRLRDSPENNEEYLLERVSLAQQDNSSNTPSPPPLHKVNSEKELNITEAAVRSRTPPRIFIRAATVDDVEAHPLPDVPSPPKKDTPPESPSTPRSSEVDFILEQREIVRTYHTPTVQTVDRELRITESLENLTDDAPTTPDKGRFQIRFVPLNNMSSEEVGDRSKSANGKVHDDDADVVVVEMEKKVPPPPPPRRRSVSDIIATIEKHQSRLRINQKNNNSVKYNFEPVKYGPTTSARRITDPKEHNNNNNNNDIDVRHIPIMVERFDEFQQDELFKKCVVMRDKSDSTIDWNPVPKPRRSRNLTHEAEMAVAQMKN